MSQIMESWVGTDSGFSSWDSSPVDTFIPQWTSSRSPLDNLFIEDKKFYLEQVSCSIKETKASFLKNCLEIDNAIEQMTNKIIEAVKLRKKELKSKLSEIQESAVWKWDRQLSFCKDGLNWLNSINDVFFQMTDLQDYFNKTFTSAIDFIDLGGIELKFEDESQILQPLQTMGKISYKSNGVSPKFIIGKAGEEPGEFCRPWGVCSDATGRILVSDRCNHRIQVFDECGKFLLEFGKQGTKPGEFLKPAGIAVDNECRIIVADKDNHRIQVFSYSGGFLFAFGKLGSDNGEFNYPWDVAVNSYCDIAVSDSKNYRVQLFNSQGVFIQKFKFVHTPGLGRRQLGSPRGLVFWPDGSLLVTDFNNHQIVILNKTFTKLKTFGTAGSEAKMFLRPQGIATDGKGKIAVSDCKNYRIQVFDSVGNLVKIFGTKGESLGQLDCPQGICFHPNGNIVVVDFGNSRLQVF